MTKSNLYIIRNEQNMIQSEIAELMGISKQTYHLKESGKGDFTITEGKRLARIFSCTLDDLFGDDEEQADSPPAINKEADNEIIQHLEKIIKIFKSK